MCSVLKYRKILKNLALRSRCGCAYFFNLLKTSTVGLPGVISCIHISDNFESTVVVIMCLSLTAELVSATPRGLITADCRASASGPRWPSVTADTCAYGWEAGPRGACGPRAQLPVAPVYR